MRKTNHADPSLWFRWVACLTASVTLLLVATTNGCRIAYLNSDIFYLPALFRDVRQGVPLHWNLPPGPYFFPDWPLYALAGGFVAPLGSTFGIYGVLIAALYMAGCVFLATTMNAPPVHGVLVAALVLMLVTFVDSAAAAGWFLPTLHGGLASLLPWMLALLLRLPPSPSHPRFVGLVALATLLALSDPLTLPQFLLPAGAVLLIAERRRMAAILTVVPTLGSIALRFCLLGLFGWLIPPGFALTDLHKKLFCLPYWSVFFRGLAQLAANQYAIVIATIVAAFLLKRALRDARNPVPKAISLARRDPALCFVACLFLFVPAVLAGGGLYSDTGNNRYFLPLLTLPLPVLLLHARRWPPTVLLAMTVGVLLFRLPALRALPTAWKTPYPDDIRCLDTLASRHGWSHGVSTYWLAKRTSYLSQRSLSVLAVSPELQPHFSIGNREWYAQTPAQFALVSTDDVALRRHLEALGRPELDRCGTVSFYAFAPLSTP